MYSKTSSLTGVEAFSHQDPLSLIIKYGMLEQLYREKIVDGWIEEIICSPEEEEEANRQVDKHFQRRSYGLIAANLNRHITAKQLVDMALRPLKIQKLKEALFGGQVYNYFLEKKEELDEVVFSLIRVQNCDIAHELYFRLTDQEATFSELACQYSQGPEARTRGIVGPVSVGSLPADLFQLLKLCPPAKASAPIALGNFFVIVRLEQFLPARLDEALRQALLDEMFEIHIQQQLSIHDSVQAAHS